MWKVNDLKSQLEKLSSQGAVKDWSVTEIDKQRKEFYLIQEKVGKDVTVGLDQDRLVRESSLDVTVTVPVDDKKLHGVAHRALFPRLDLNLQLAQLMEAAKVSTEKAWSYPEPSQRAKVKPELCYQGLKDHFESTAEGILEDMNQAIASVDEGEFNSSEIFVSKLDQRTVTSTGFENESTISKIFSEVCFSHDLNENQSEEFLITGWNCHPEQFNYVKMCQDSAEFAKKSLDTERPQSGSFAVIVPTDVIAQIMMDSVSHMKKSAEYYNMPFMPEGSEFVKNFSGDAFEMSLDPAANYMLGSTSFDGLGLAQQPYSLLKGNRVIGNINSPQFAQYTGSQTTPYLGNLKIEAKGKTFEKLTSSAPQVLEILQFSGLFSSPLDLTFSSEIRLARLYDNEKGTVKYIKGGSLSGNLLQNLQKVMWSKEQQTHHIAEWGGRCQGYLGPKYALLSDVSISS